MIVEDEILAVTTKPKPSEGILAETQNEVERQ